MADYLCSPAIQTSMIVTGKHKKPRNFKSDMDFSEFKAAAKEKGVTIKVLNRTSICGKWYGPHQGTAEERKAGKPRDTVQVIPSVADRLVAAGHAKRIKG